MLFYYLIPVYIELTNKRTHGSAAQTNFYLYPNNNVIRTIISAQMHRQFNSSEISFNNYLKDHIHGLQSLIWTEA